MNATQRKLIEANSAIDPKARDEARRYEIIQALRRGTNDGTTDGSNRIPSEHEELATLRKAVSMLISIVATQNGWDEAQTRETFRDFFTQTDIVNAAKAHVDRELGIGGDNFGY